MLTPIDLKNNYFDLLGESERITGVKPVNYTFKQHYQNLTQEQFLTSEQWDNLVKVAAIIKANIRRFHMNEWHKESNCGTCHCLSGWAQSLEQNDTNYSGKGALAAGERILSEFVSPFFWISSRNLIPDSELHDDHEGLPEQLVMKYLINPVLEEASRESYELSSELNEFIQKAKQETLVAN